MLGMRGWFFGLKGDELFARIAVRACQVGMPSVYVGHE